MTDAALAEKPLVFLPVGNDYRATREGSLIDTSTAAAIFRRMAELGCKNTYGPEAVKTRRVTEEETQAWQEGRLRGYYKDAPRDRHDYMMFVNLPGVLSDVFVEFGYPAEVLDADKAKVQIFFDEVTEAERRADRALRRLAYEAKVEAFFAEHPQSPAVERFLRTQCRFGERTAREPRMADMHEHWTNRLNSVTNPYGGATTAEAPFTPEHSGFKLKLREAVHYGASQESYADHSFTLIPVEAEGVTDVEAAKRNLYKISRKLNTHNGWAGSGTGYSLSLVIEEDGLYVLMDARHSISD